MSNSFYTVGHSTHPLADFVGLLQDASVTLVADVRAMPRSWTNPQYNHDVLPQSLAPFSIGYEHIVALGGRRGKVRSTLPNVNSFWQNESFHNYADYAMGRQFHAGLVRLRELGRTESCAIMCAEALWWRCHRRIIADYLVATGEKVFHIMGRGHIERAQLSQAAHYDASGILTYPDNK